MNKLINIVSAILSELKRPSTSQILAAILEEQKKQTELLQKILDSLTVEEAVKINIPEGMIEEQP